MRKAVVLFNLGGPQHIDNVKSFLFNLFNDSAIISLPQPFRSVVAWIITQLRASKASNIYRFLGGGSPILKNTCDQANLLQLKLGSDYKVFIVMRYWHPRAQHVIKSIKRYKPDLYYLLPLYPHFSTSTTASSLSEFKELAKVHLQNIPSYTFCCYPIQYNWIQAQVDLINTAIINEKRPYRLLFTAHSLPQRNINNGDPYQYQIELTVNAIMKHFPDQDFKICYQSRVGPVKWIGPMLENEILQAAHDKRGVFLIPISFVSEHSETLYELDHLYRNVAISKQIPFYNRISTVATHPYFIDALENLIKKSDHHKPGIISPQVCSKSLSKCYYH